MAPTERELTRGSLKLNAKRKILARKSLTITSSH